jgi:hypothetical protein
MKSMKAIELNETQRGQAEAAAETALTFLASRGDTLGGAIVRHAWKGGSSADVIAALAHYQNPDGGFGKGLEVDIKSPVSNPFAARLAMQVMRAVDRDASEDMRDRLKSWLVSNQDKDGDWHFAPEVYDATLAPWFAGWEFPSLNPSCCIVGNAIPLDITTPKMRERVEQLFARKASLDDPRSGDFYTMLPYVEYVAIAALEEPESWFDAIADGIRKSHESGNYSDAQHFFDHAINAGPEVASRVPVEFFQHWTDTLLDEQQPDGGWPTPYDEGWRPWTTAMAMVTLARLRDGV